MVVMLKIISCCLTRLYFVIICDACVIMDGISVIQNRIIIFSLIEGTDIIVNLIAYYVWGSEDELTCALSENVESWY